MTPGRYSRHNKRLMIYYQWGLDVNVRVPDSGRTNRAISIACATGHPLKAGVVPCAPRAVCQIRAG